jgi:Domain of unknown function (DUF222)
VSTAPAPAFGSAAEALAVVRAGLSYLAAADPTTLTAAEQADCLIQLEQANAIGTAAMAWFLGAFTAERGHEADADRSPRTWLIHKTRVTEGAAAGHVGWARRAVQHPLVMTELATGRMLTESMARVICGYSDKLPADCRADADEVLVGVARAGARQEDLARLAAQMYERSRSAPDEDTDDGFEDRSVRLETTFGGAGVLTGNLTPECAAAVRAVLDALSAPGGAEDTRTREQRYHDGLADAARRLAAAGLLPERAGAPVKALVHITLAELLAMDGGSALQRQWAARAAEQWAGHRAAASVAGGDGGAWLTGAATRAVACDAMLIPVVTGEVDLGALDALVALCVELSRLDRQDEPEPDAEAPPPGVMAREALMQAIIGKAVDLVSGPGGLASLLRRGLLGARLAGPSLPLDVGVSSTIPAAIRTAVILRDQHCQWAGGCNQPAAACEVHHLTHQANGGKTSVKDCGLYCTYHHQVVIHHWGWTVTMNPDGTTTARSPDGLKVFRSHGPPPTGISAA